MIMLLNNTVRLPELMDTTYVAPTGSTIVVGSGGDFQAALNSANPGDVITLNAGSTYSGNYSLPAKGGSSYIHIRSSATLTTEGTRVTTSNLSGFPKIQTPNTTAAIQAAAGAHHYRFINCDILSSSTATNGGLVKIGTGDESNTADFPHHIIIDRCGVRGSSSNGGRRGVMMSGSYQAVIDSYLSDWKEVGADTQAIASWNGYGPYKVVNNYIEGSGENMLVGGNDTPIGNLTPSDIEVRGNLFFKPLSWWPLHGTYAGTNWTVKNSFELKHAKRVLVESNVFENCWSGGQNGYAVLFTVRNQSGTNPWAIVADVTFQYNTIRHSANGINCLGFDIETGIPSQYCKRLNIYRNLIYDIGLVPADGDGNAFQVQYGYDDITINHNTALSPRAIIIADGLEMRRFKFTNNITQHGLYGITGSGYGGGNATIDHFFPGGDFSKNVIVMDTGNYASSYPPDNYMSDDALTDVGFVNLTNYADLRLAPSSAYNNAGNDGTDCGADLATPA